MEKEVLLQMTDITKRFPGTLALDRVHLEVKKGTVHILLGENGAGKSTLVKIIAGEYERDSGEMEFEGKPAAFQGIRETIDAGISMIHQELNLLPERTIAQNVFAGHEPMQEKCPFMVDHTKMRLETKRILDSLGLDYEVDAQVKDLSIAQCQMVEVVKALSNRIKLLIMDEPTSSLTVKEIDKLFEIIEKLRSSGIGIIYISHRMDEIKRIGDQVTIMRDGKVIDTVQAAGMDIDSAISKMVGRKIEKLYDRRIQMPGAVLLKTEGLTGARFRNVSIEVRAGEIVSLSGLVGAGRSEIAKALFGYEPIISGSAQIMGKKITRTTPARSKRLGMAFLPEDRKNEGLFLQMSISENITAASLKKWFPHGVTRTRTEDRVAQEYIKKMKVATSGARKKVLELSGGNQQKVAIAKWLATDCKLLIMDEPTRGIDVGAKAEIYKLMDELASDGYGILMISSELNEVIGVSDRVYVMREGDIVCMLERGDISQEKIMQYTLNGVETI